MDESINGIFTEQTCGEACWCAKEDICRCSCGGKNHGVLRTADGIRPVRTAKIDGYRYELLAVGERKELIPVVSKLMRELPPYRDDVVKDTSGKEYHYTSHWRDTDKGSPYRFKYATQVQIANWAELNQFKGMDRCEIYCKAPSLLWKQV